ncbi:MAG: zinc transporter ZupT [Armatimonadota bacterium]
MQPELLRGLVLSLIAGLATTIGAATVLVVRRFSGRTLSVLLGFAAGVMIAVSFLELYAGGVETIGLAPASLAFFAGFGALFLLDLLIPHQYETETTTGESDKLLRAGMLTALGIAIHNFPEGLVVLSGAASSERLAVALTIAIALHNIPEGIAVAVPIAAATGDRRRAFMCSLLSGLSEPVGALLGALVLTHIMTETVIASLLAGVGGLMVFISLDELLPTAHRYEQEHAATAGVACGMIMMITTLVLLK